MAAPNGCEGIACNHPSCGPGATRNAVDLGRRDFLKDAFAATAGLTGLGALGGCAEPVVQETSAMQSAELILINGRIATLNPRAPAASALAMRGGTILAIGSAAEVEKLRGPDTRVIDAGGRSVVPGLNDGHTHFIRGGLTYTNEVRWDGVPSLAEGLRRVREQARRTPAPHWVQVIGGWTWAQFAEKRYPTLEEINAATGDTPCMIMHLYDRAWLNRAGIRALGWNKETPNMFGGAIERDASGNATGLVMSTTSLASLVSVWLRIPRLSPEDQILSTRHFMREHNRLGVTSVIDAGGGGQNYPDNYAAIAKLAADGQMTLRIGYSLFAQAPGKELDNYTAWAKLVKYGEGDDYYRMIGTGEYILYAAGDVANFAKDYPVPTAGVMEKNLSAVVKFIVQQGWPFRQHTSFDASASRVLDVLEQVNREIPLTNLRWGLDHCEALQPKTLERLAALGGSIDIQNRMSLDGEAFLKKYGEQAAADAPPIARIREMGIPLACGTDGNRATSYNPWIGLHWLVTGKTLGGAKLQGDRNLLDRTEALRLYTAGGAWVSGEEGKKGTLEVGKFADLCILSSDYFSVPSEAIKDIESLLTVVGGKVVYGAGPYSRLSPPLPPVSQEWLPVREYGEYYKRGREDAQNLARSFSRPQLIGDGGWGEACGCGAI
jgi:predicted amidohydrolase YtcJ